MRKICPRAISRLQPRPAGSTSSWIARQGASALSCRTAGEPTSMGIVMRPVLRVIAPRRSHGPARGGERRVRRLALDLPDVGLRQREAALVLGPRRASRRSSGPGRSCGPPARTASVDRRRRIGRGGVERVGRVREDDQRVHLDAQLDVGARAASCAGTQRDAALRRRRRRARRSSRSPRCRACRARACDSSTTKLSRALR